MENSVASEMMCEINKLNNALIDTYVALTGGRDNSDVLTRIANGEDFKSLTVDRAKEVVRTITGGHCKP